MYGSERRCRQAPSRRGRAATGGCSPIGPPRAPSRRGPRSATPASRSRRLSRAPARRSPAPHGRRAAGRRSSARAPPTDRPGRAGGGGSVRPAPRDRRGRDRERRPHRSPPATNVPPSAPPFALGGDAGATGAVEPVELGDVVVREREVEDLAILGDPLAVNRLRDDGDPALAG